MGCILRYKIASEFGDSGVNHVTGFETHRACTTPRTRFMIKTAATRRRDNEDERPRTLGLSGLSVIVGEAAVAVARGCTLAALISHIGNG